MVFEERTFKKSARGWFSLGLKVLAGLELEMLFDAICGCLSFDVSCVVCVGVCCGVFFSSACDVVWCVGCCSVGDVRAVVLLLLCFGEGVVLRFVEREGGQPTLAAEGEEGE